MAAKLKKRALAEYQSQVSVEDGSENKDPSSKGNKKLKLLMPPRLDFYLSSRILYVLLLATQYSTHFMKTQDFDRWRFLHTTTATFWSYNS